MDEREELEQVPWQDLFAETDPEDQRRRAIYMGAGLVGAMIAGIVMARMWFEPGPPPTPVAPAVEEGVDADLLDEAALPEIPGLPLYSEADLMAHPADPGQRAAMARAEWFVTDYFTADLEPNGSADVRAALPSGALEAYPQDSSGTVSYVEWARAFRVEPAGDGTYRVGVVFRTLAAPPDRGFIRQPVRAVEIRVAVTGDGGATVLDIPSPMPLPAGPESHALAEPVVDAPQAIVEAAAFQVSGWGSDPRVVSVHRSGADWRVVVTVADAAGTRWPLAVHVPGA
jgi:hypothetical protein